MFGSELSKPNLRRILLSSFLWQSFLLSCPLLSSPEKHYNGNIAISRHSLTYNITTLIARFVFKKHNDSPYLFQLRLTKHSNAQLSGYQDS
jgi:hypothetical protein